jgi:hypothetical protein
MARRYMRQVHAWPGVTGIKAGSALATRNWEGIGDGCCRPNHDGVIDMDKCLGLLWMNS